MSQDTTSLTPAQAAAARMREADGIDLFRAALAGIGPRAPYAELMNITLREVEVGRILFASTPERKFYNPMGSVHGGYYGGLLDTAMGCAVHTTLKKGFAYTTLEYKVHLVRTMTEETGPVQCEGRIINAGSRVATAEARIVDPAGKLYAHGTTTCLIFEV